MLLSFSAVRAREWLQSYKQFEEEEREEGCELKHWPVYMLPAPWYSEGAALFCSIENSEIFDRWSIDNEDIPGYQKELGEGYGFRMHWEVVNGPNREGNYWGALVRLTGWDFWGPSCPTRSVNDPWLKDSKGDAHMALQAQTERPTLF